MAARWTDQIPRRLGHPAPEPVQAAPPEAPTAVRRGAASCTHLRWNRRNRRHHRGVERRRRRPLDLGREWNNQHRERGNHVGTDRYRQHEPAHVRLLIGRNRFSSSGGLDTGATRRFQFAAVSAQLSARATAQTSSFLSVASRLLILRAGGPEQWTDTTNPNTSTRCGRTTRYRVVEREIVVSREDVPERDAVRMRDADIRRERDMPRDTDMSRDDDDMPRDSDLPKRQATSSGWAAARCRSHLTIPRQRPKLTRRRTTACAAWTWMSLLEPGMCRGARVRPASIWAAAEPGPISSSALPDLTTIAACGSRLRRFFCARSQSRTCRLVTPVRHRAPDLVELQALDPTIKLDIRYATTNNLTGRAVYTEARAFLQRPAAEALVRVHHSLAPTGLRARSCSTGTGPGGSRSCSGRSRRPCNTSSSPIRRRDRSTTAAARSISRCTTWQAASQWTCRATTTRCRRAPTPITTVAPPRRARAGISSAPRCSGKRSRSSRRSGGTSTTRTGTQYPILDIPFTEIPLQPAR